jgi:hypothetical protein
MSLSQIVYDGSTGPNPQSWINLQANKVYCNELNVMGSVIEEYELEVELSTYDISNNVVAPNILTKTIKILKFGDFVQIFVPNFNYTTAAVYSYVEFQLPQDVIPLTSKACPIISELNATVGMSIALIDISGKFRFYKDFARANFAISDFYEVLSQTLVYNI